MTDIIGGERRRMMQEAKDIDDKFKAAREEFIEHTEDFGKGGFT